MTTRKHDNNLIKAIAAVVIVFGITAAAVLSIDSELKKRKASETKQDSIVPSILPGDYSGSEIDNDSTETELPVGNTAESAEDNETSPADYSYVDDGIILLEPEDLTTDESAESEQENPETTYSPDENDLPAIPLE